MHVHPGLGFFVRARDCETLEALLAKARAGHSAILVIRGKTGNGKTVVLQDAGVSGIRCEPVGGATSRPRPAGTTLAP